MRVDETALLTGLVLGAFAGHVPPQYQVSQRTEAKSTHVLDRKFTNKTKTKISCKAKREIVG